MNLIREQRVRAGYKMEVCSGIGELHKVLKPYDRHLVVRGLVVSALEVG
jgi:hypothetical protein